MILTLLFAGAAVGSGASSEIVTPATLRQALARYQAIERLDVDFKQTKTLKDIQMKLESEGHLRLTPPGHVQWKVLKPEPLTVDLEQEKMTIQSGSSTQTYSQSENPSVKDRRSFTTLLGWLKLDADAILAQYDGVQIAPRQFRFTAKNKTESTLQSLAMTLTQGGHLTQLIFQEASGDEIRLDFKTPQVRYRKAAKTR